jgi:hypothetical protein
MWSSPTPPSSSITSSPRRPPVDDTTETSALSEIGRATTTVMFVWQWLDANRRTWRDLSVGYETEALARELDPRRFNAVPMGYAARLVRRAITDRPVPS